MIKFIYIFSSLLAFGIFVVGCGNFEGKSEHFDQPLPVMDRGQISALRVKYRKLVDEARQRVCESYRERNYTAISHSYALSVINFRQKLRDSSSGSNDPLLMHSDVLCGLEKK
jgi:hypothetical protein